MSAPNLMGQTQKMVGKKTWRANKLGEPNTKLGEPMHRRHTRSAATVVVGLYAWWIFIFVLTWKTRVTPFKILSELFKIINGYFVCSTNIYNSLHFPQLNFSVFVIQSKGHHYKLNISRTSTKTFKTYFINMLGIVYLAIIFSFTVNVIVLKLDCLLLILLTAVNGFTSMQFFVSESISIKTLKGHVQKSLKWPLFDLRKKQKTVVWIVSLVLFLISIWLW